MKISLSQLEQYLSEAAWILKGPVDASDFKAYIFPLLFFKRISDVSKIASNLKMEVAAGHGLKESNIPAILKIKEIQELNIGHHIIADSIFLGLDVKILKILSLLRNSK